MLTAALAVVEVVINRLTSIWAELELESRPMLPNTTKYNAPAATRVIVITKRMAMISEIAGCLGYLTCTKQCCIYKGRTHDTTLYDWRHYAHVTACKIVSVDPLENWTVNWNWYVVPLLHVTASLWYAVPPGGIGVVPADPPGDTP